MRALLIALVLLPVAAAADKRDDAASEMAKADDDFFNKKDYQSAIAHYNAARLLAPDRPGPYLALGIAYAQVNDCKSATSMMQKYLQLKTTDPKPDAQRIIDQCKGKVDACPPGMLKNADTANHCCWPGQVWAPSENHCVGAPNCPAGFMPGPHGRGCLATGNCPPGKVVAQDPTQCCWPGQGYSHEKRACVGAAICPPNMVPTGPSADDCRPAPTGRVPGRLAAPPLPGPLPGQLDAVTIRDAMNKRVKPLVSTCYQQYRRRGQVRITFTVVKNGTVQHVRVWPPFANSPIGICLEETLLSATFPPFNGPTQNITYPFDLR